MSGTVPPPAWLCPHCGAELDETRGLSAPGHRMGEPAEVIGWRKALAIGWRAIERARTAQECRDAIAELGTKPPPETIR